MATETTLVNYIEGAAASTPAASRVVTYAKADGLVYSKDDAGAETLMSSGSVGSVATDPIWDAAGDLVQGTGANTAAKLGAGTAAMFLKSAGVAAANLWAYPPGYEIDYVAITSPVALSNTTEGTAHTVITGTSVTYENVPYVIDVYTPDLLHQGDGLTIVLLFDGATVLGRVGISVGASGDRHPALMSYRLTPTAAAHQYIVKAYVSSGAATIGCGAGGTGAYLPAFIRVTKV